MLEGDRKPNVTRAAPKLAFHWYGLAATTWPGNGRACAHDAPPSDERISVTAVSHESASASGVPQYGHAGESQ